MERKWDVQLDFVRIIAGFFVVVVHVMANSVKFSSFAYYTDLIASSGIFMFIILSGWTNTLSYQNRRRGPGYNHLFNPAAKKLLLPYIGWTLIYTMINGYLNAKPLLGLTQGIKLGENLWTGSAWYHLYFMVLLIYLYLVYGFLFELLHRFKWQTMLFFSLTPIGITYLVNQVAMPPLLNRFLYLSPLNWWGLLFIIGMRWGLQFRLEDWQGHLKLKGLIAGMTVGYFGLYAVVLELFHQTNQTAWYSVMMYLRGAYTFLALLLFYGLGYYLMRRFTKLKKHVKALSSHIYTLYFCHPVIICITDQLQQQHLMFKTITAGPLLLKLVLVLTASLILTYSIDGLQNKLHQLWTKKA
ncbi:acyltransferase family protein [Agrilactobacillus yilanensis]|uniref:Acyltransferase family protein n=1 Tax=Agrilactobacillus yilanensis TaxID=2485997 RepID=A0ABW4J6F4_9LACO|nr:acyltransferase [Agrilactobacillus yilanensis]